MPTLGKLTVLQAFPIWLPQTQTWMYNQTVELQHLDVDAQVACERTENLDQFGVANIHALAGEPKWWQVWDKGSIPILLVFFCQGTEADSGWTRVTLPARAWRNAGQLQPVAWII
jgi:hypothetical protein